MLWGFAAGEDDRGHRAIDDASRRTWKLTMCPYCSGFLRNEVLPKGSQATPVPQLLLKW